MNNIEFLEVMKEDKFIYKETIVTNFINDLSEKQDKFIQNQLIDHIMHNGKKYRVINICESKVKEIIDNGLKYEQLRKENEELHGTNLRLNSMIDFYENIRRGRKGPHQTISEIIKEYEQLKKQETKLAVEKLEELLSKIYESKCEEINLTLYIKWDDFLTEINSMIEKLKGEQND